jgi:hypothetical protein
MSDDLAPSHEEYERQIYDLRQLLEISKSLNSTLDYVILIDSILFTVMGQMKVLKAGLFAKKGLDSPSFSLHRNHKGFDLNHDVEYAIQEDHPVIQLFSQAYGCYTLSEIQNRLGSLDGLEGLVAAGPVPGHPSEGQGRGQRHPDHRGSHRRGGVHRVRAGIRVNIAILAAIAINNAFLFEMTTTDMMTKLKMKHYFYTVLLERMEASVQEDKPLSWSWRTSTISRLFNGRLRSFLRGPCAQADGHHSAGKHARGGCGRPVRGGGFLLLLPDTTGPTRWP